MGLRSDLPRAVLARFVPACAALLGAVLFALALAEPGGLRAAALALAAGEVAAMAAGYAAALAGLARRLPPGALRRGGRSVAAAVAAVVGLAGLAGATQGATLAAVAVLSAGAGALAALLVWLPLVRRPGGHAAAAPADPEVAAALAALDAELARPRELPPARPAPRPAPRRDPAPPDRAGRGPARRAA
jgi:hypothetical protein